MRWHLGDVRRRVAHNRAHSNRRLGGCDSCLWVPPRLCAGRTTGCVSDEPLFAYTRAARKLRQTEVGAFHEGNVVRVTTDQLSQDPSFSPDGSRVVFSSGRDGEFDPEVGYSRLALFTANSTGGDEERLTSGVYDYEPDWSPNGSKVVFVRRRYSASQNPQEDFLSRRSCGTIPVPPVAVFIISPQPGSRWSSPPEERPDAGEDPTLVVRFGVLRVTLARFRESHDDYHHP
jgi:dipeptidyl aminopeptidase/acylaminoacyl peptidase